MPQLRAIDATGWGALAGQTLTVANSGSAASSRLTALTAGAWTLRAAGSAELPPGSGATGYAESATGALAMLQVDPTGTALAGAPPAGDAADYWLDLWLMGVWDGATQLPTAQSDFLILAITSAYLHCQICCNGASGAPYYNPPGWALVTGNSAATPPRSIYLQGNVTEAVYGQWGRWNRLTFHVRYGASGVVEALLNGALVSRTTTDTTAITWSGQALQIKLPAWAGVKWRVTGPVRSYSGGDLAVRPVYALDEQPQSLVTRLFHPFALAAAGAATQGAYFQASGAGTVSDDATEYGLTGVSPLRRRMNFTGNGQSPTATTIDEIGALPVNEQGWSHIALSDLYVPTGAALTMQALEAGGSAALLTLSVTSGGLYYGYQNGSLALATPWNHAARQCVLLHLNRDGRARLTTVDLTTSALATSATKIVASAALVDWTPQPLGKLRLVGTPTAVNIEAGYVAICRRPSLSLVDSMTSAAYAGANPAIQTADHVARAFPYGAEFHSLPGGYYPLAQHGLERRLIVAPLARGGLARREWTHLMLAGMTHTCGVELVNFDGGSVNDLTQIQTGNSAAALASLRENVAALLDLCARNDCSCWLATMLPRERSATVTGATNASPIVLTAPSHGIAGATTRLYVAGATGNTAVNGFWASAQIVDANTLSLTGSSGNGAYTGGGTIMGYTPQELAALSEFNAELRRLAAAQQRKGLITLSDIEQDYLANPSLYPNTGGAAGFWQDFTHSNTGPHAQGSGIIARRMAQTRVTPPTRAPLRRLAAR